MIELWIDRTYKKLWFKKREFVSKILKNHIEQYFETT